MFKNVKYLVVTTIGIAVSLIGCSSLDRNVAQAQSKPKVVASHNVICDLVETIASDTVDLTCLIKANQDPHTYRPTPSQLKAMESAQLVLYGGYQLEPKITKLLEATGEKIPKIALYEQVVTEPIMAEHEHSSEEVEHDHSAAESQPELEPDPHVWHSIENTVAMVEFLRSILLQLNPQQAEVYLTNSTALTEQLWQLDAWIKEQIATIPEGQRVLVTTHDSLNYYVSSYNLDDYQTLQGLSTEASPTASEVKELAGAIAQTRVPTIFVESTKSDRVINNVARAANVELSESELYVDGLGSADNYTEMMSYNTCAIVNGLGGECEPFISQQSTVNSQQSTVNN